MYYPLKNIKKILINKNESIKSVIKNINKSGLKIAIVVSSNRKLEGTVVDGDIRRGLIKGLTIQNKVKDIMYKNPHIIKNNVSEIEAQKIIKSNFLEHLPVISKNKKVIGMFTNEEIVNFQKKRANQFIIMAGGKGKRLLPITKNKPKALIDVMGRPMTERLILNAKKNGFNNFVITINYLGEMIKKYFQDGKKFKVKINYFKEKKFLGTAGSLYNLKTKKNHTVLVTNCDILSDVDYGNIIDYHQKNKASATIVVKKFENKNPYGVITASGNRFVSFQEKPVKIENINAGIYVFENKLFRLIRKNKFLEMTDFFKVINKKNYKIIVYPILENWSDFGQKKIH